MDKRFTMSQMECCSNQLERVAEEYGKLIRDFPTWTPGGEIVPLLRNIADMYQEVRSNPSLENIEKSRVLIVDTMALLQEVRSVQMRSRESRHRESHRFPLLTYGEWNAADWDAE